MTPPRRCRPPVTVCWQSVDFLTPLEYPQPCRIQRRGLVFGGRPGSRNCGKKGRTIFEYADGKPIQNPPARRSHDNVLLQAYSPPMPPRLIWMNPRKRLESTR